MKKLYSIFMMIVVMPMVCMEADRVIPFKVSNGIVAIPELNLQLIKTLHNHYFKHKTKADVEGVVPLFANVSVQALSLVNNALNVGPYKFDEYYSKLSSNDRRLLIKAAGQYGDDSKKLMLNVPELTKQLIEVYFTDRTLRTYIKSYFKDEDEDYLKNYFREKLVYNKSLFGAWAPKILITEEMSHIVRLLTEEIYPGALLLNGYHTKDQCVYTIPLPIGDMVHQTSGSCFITSTHECRVVDVRNNQCVVWLVNHNDFRFHKTTRIKHKGAIKGCCLSKTETGVGYAVTYSECDMVFSTITTHKNGQSVIESVHVEIPNEGTLVDACFDHDSQQFFVATYEGLNSVFRRWSMEGKLLDEIVWSFKEHAFIEKIFVSRNSLGLLFGVDDQCALYTYKRLNNGNWEFDSSTELRNKYDKGYVYSRIDIHGVRLIPRGDSVFMYDLSCSPFAVRAGTPEVKSKQSSGFFGDWINTFMSQSEETSEHYYLYSPEGQFLLRNSLKNKLGVRWVETVVLDAVTHKQIFSIDTLFQNFAGVGFTHDGNKLIFLNHVGLHEKVELLNDDDKNMLQAIEDVAFHNVGITSLLKRLCMECKENGAVTLQTHSPAYHLLYDWVCKSPALRTLLTSCLPLCVKKIGVSRK